MRDGRVFTRGAATLQNLVEQNEKNTERLSEADHHNTQGLHRCFKLSLTYILDSFLILQNFKKNRQYIQNFDCSNPIVSAQNQVKLSELKIKAWCREVISTFPSRHPLPLPGCMNNGTAGQIRAHSYAIALINPLFAWVFNEIIWMLDEFFHWLRTSSPRQM